MYDFLGSPTLMPFDPSKGRNPQGGKTYYVNEEIGNNDYEGTDPQFPLATLIAAVAKCVDKKHDYVFVQRLHSVGALVEFDKTHVHLIGLNYGGFVQDNQEGCHINGGALPAIDFNRASPDHAQYVEIAGFNIDGNGASPAIQITQNVQFIHIHHCEIGNGLEGSATYGIYAVPPAEFDLCTIDHCLFGNGLTQNHLHYCAFTGAIAHNLFRQPAVGCIAPQGAAWLHIFGNMFFKNRDPALAIGWAVHLDVNTYDCAVMGNIAAEHAGATLTVVPWKDDSGAGANANNGWSGNRAGDNCVNPA